MYGTSENQAAITSYLLFSSTSSINLYGERIPPAAIAKIRGVTPETSATPSSFFVTGCFHF